MLSSLTTSKASGKMADVVEGSRVFFADGGPIYVCVAHIDGNFYFQDESGKRNMCFSDNIVQVSSFVPKLKANVNLGGVIMPL